MYHQKSKFCFCCQNVVSNLLSMKWNFWEWVRISSRHASTDKYMNESGMMNLVWIDFRFDLRQFGITLLTDFNLMNYNIFLRCRWYTLLLTNKQTHHTANFFVLDDHIFLYGRTSQTVFSGTSDSQHSSDSRTFQIFNLKTWIRRQNINDKMDFSMVKFKISRWRFLVLSWSVK